VAEFDADREAHATRVLADGLEPETTYRYRAVTSGSDDMPWHSFTTAPTAGTYPAESGSDGAFAFAVAGDLQPFNDETVRTTTMALEKIGSLNPAFILQVGDVSEVGISSRSWRVASSVLSVAGAEVPLVVTAGNHDYYYGLPSTRNFKSFFPAPYAGGDQLKKNTWYSQTVGPVHIAVLDTEADGRDFEAQREWLVADLAAATDAGIEWLFISMHRPILASATGSEDQKWARALFPLIAQYDVDAVFWGHDHMYEHYEYQYGANGYVLDPSDPVAAEPTHYFTVGSAGSRVDALYGGFFTHRPYLETWEMYNAATGSPETFEFTQRPWRAENVKEDEPGIRYQNPEIYPGAASYYSYPFDSAADAQAGRYSTNPEVRYNDDAEFFGYTYGETSIHYLWVEVTDEQCVITAHYVDGPAGAQGEVIASPDGRQERWVLE